MVQGQCFVSPPPGHPPSILVGDSSTILERASRHREARPGSFSGQTIHREVTKVRRREDGREERRTGDRYERSASIGLRDAAARRETGVAIQRLVDRAGRLACTCVLPVSPTLSNLQRHPLGLPRDWLAGGSWVDSQGAEPDLDRLPDPYLPSAVSRWGNRGGVGLGRDASLIGEWASGVRFCDKCQSFYDIGLGFYNINRGFYYVSHGYRVKAEAYYIN